MKLNDIVRFKDTANVSGDLVGLNFKIIEVGRVNVRLRGKDAYNRPRVFIARRSALDVIR